MTTPTWNSESHPDDPKIGVLGWIRAIMRAVPLVVLVFGGLLILLLVRLVEYPVFGMHRPWTPHITVFVCRNALRLLGIGFRVHGRPLTGQGAMVANHASWLDIFALNATTPLYFVSKSEVARWPGIGWLARATGTVFVIRDRKEARAQTEMFQARLQAGHRLLFFPEGTSTDGLQVLPFKTTLFASFLLPELKESVFLQAVSVRYHAPTGADPRFYGWWGDMGFGTHLISTLAAAKQGRVEIMYHAPVAAADFENRKAVAKVLEDATRAGHSELT